MKKLAFLLFAMACGLSSMVRAQTHSEQAALQAITNSKLDQVISNTGTGGSATTDTALTTVKVMQSRQYNKESSIAGHIVSNVSSDTSLTTIKVQLAYLQNKLNSLSGHFVSNGATDTALTTIKVQIAYMQNKLNSLAGHFVSNGATDTALTTLKAQIAYLQNKENSISSNTSSTSSAISSLNSYQANYASFVTGWSTSYITTNTTTAVKAGTGVLHNILVGTTAASGTIAFYDCNNCTSNQMGQVLMTGFTGVLPLDYIFTNGLTIVTAVAAGKITIGYK